MSSLKFAFPDVTTFLPDNLSEVKKCSICWIQTLICFYINSWFWSLQQLIRIDNLFIRQKTSKNEPLLKKLILKQIVINVIYLFN